MSKNNNWSLIGLFFLLVVLPAGSWFFMQRGADFRMKALGELDELGQFPAVSLFLPDGDTLTSEDLSNKVLMVNFFPENVSPEAPEVRQMKWIQSQFLERLLNREEFRFLSLVPVDSAAQLAPLVRAMDLSDKQFRRWIVAGAPADNLKKWATGYLHLPLKAGQTPLHNPYIAIVDMEGKVRHFYDMMNTEEVGKLMVHLPILMPEKDDRKVDIKTAQ
ncbi:MAG: hypothetical protein D6714_02235 [Bacteroidetes bacterium]|nr:MAG: hypothetical protein D6714_02235 [Bacteroidota bacterium]